MRLRLFGCDHSRVAPSRLERLSADAERIKARLLELRQRGALRGAFVLSTCNRFEVLVDLADAPAEDAAATVDPDRLADELFGTELPLRRCRDLDAVDYLLGVATGVHSMVFGEEQILGQLRDAFREAERLGLLSRRLQMLRSRLLSTAREVRRRTGLDKRPPSVASLAVEQLLGAGPRIAVVGAGATGRLLLEILQRRRITDVLVVNRTLAKAEALARHFGGRAMALAEFTAARPELDGVVYAVHSDAPLLSYGDAQGLAVVVDISQPSVLDAELRTAARGGVRDGQPAAAGLPRVLTLDELSALASPREQRYAARKQTALIEVRAFAERLCAELAQGRPDLGRVVDLHLEGALSELQQALAAQLSHLQDHDRDNLRQLLERTARRAAHYHIQDLRRLASAR